MMVALKFVGAYSGILNEAKVRDVYEDNKYKAMDAVIAVTKAQFDEKKEKIAAALALAEQGRKNKKLLDEFGGRWSFMQSLVEKLAERAEKNENP